MTEATARGWAHNPTRDWVVGEATLARAVGPLATAGVALLRAVHAQHLVDRGRALPSNGANLPRAEV